MVSKKIIFLVGLLILLFPFITSAQAVDPSEEIFEAKVIEVLEEKYSEEGSGEILGQKLKLRALEGSWQDQEIIFDGTQEELVARRIYKKGDKVVVSYTQGIEGEDLFFVMNYVRRTKIYILALIFILVAILIGRWKGIRALIGLAVSLLVILKFIVPRILAGSNPLFITIIGSVILLAFTLYFVHGLNRKTTAAVLGVFLSLIVTGFLAIIFINAAKLMGFVSEEIFYLAISTDFTLNTQGILLAGVIIGALGVLADVTISQSSTCEQIYDLNPNLKIKEVYRRGMKVGVDHVASMINTLVLAYTGSALGLLLLFSLDSSLYLAEGFRQVINNEQIATEIVRMLVGSIGLILAVPITTFIASYIFKKKKKVD